jgi:hypothetical protein
MRCCPAPQHGRHTSVRNYRIGLLVDDVKAPRWVSDLADWANSHGSIELDCIIVCPPRGVTPVEALFAVENSILSRRGEYSEHAALHSLTGRAPIKFLRLAERDRKGRLVIDANGVREVEDLHLDALVCCSRSTPAGAILDASRDGIISILASIDLGASGAAGFTDVLEGNADTHFTIERLCKPGASREIFFSGSIATALLYTWNRVGLHARALPYLRATLERLASGDRSRTVAESAEPNTPGLADVGRYVLRTLRRCTAKAMRRLSGSEFNWQVAIATEAWWNCRFDHGKIIPNPSGAFLADPFTITFGGVTYLFVEEFPFETRKGVITAYRIEDGEARRIGVALEEPYHLSFPFLFRHEGEVYMVPEGGADRSIKLYKSSSFPAEWSEVKVLMSDVSAVDTILFRDSSLWWMLTTIKGEGPGLNNAELHAFYASDLFGDWLPHQQNPVVMDARKGRNGGFCRDQTGAPCRVAQSPGFTFYGAGSAIYRIDELTPQTYRETLVSEIKPDFLAGLDGTHHLHSEQGVTVYDFMRVGRPGETSQARHTD